MQHGSSDVDPPRRRIRWRTCYRIIPSRFPPIHLFARVAPADDWHALQALEALTNDRLRDESGAVTIVPPDERALGPGSAYLMAPFTHLSPTGARFSDARSGAYYAARTLATSVAETRFHRERFMRATSEPPMHLDMLVLEAGVDARMHDIRGRRVALHDVYDAANYGAGQRLARRLRESGSEGIAYDSVRHDGGECIAVFRPRRLHDCKATMQLAYVWDGDAISTVYEKREFGEL